MERYMKAIEEELRRLNYITIIDKIKLVHNEPLPGDQGDIKLYIDVTTNGDELPYLMLTLSINAIDGLIHPNSLVSQEWQPMEWHRF